MANVDRLSEVSLELASVAGIVANVCDHAEHNEPLDVEDVRRSGERLRMLSVRTAKLAGRDPFLLYARRLGEIERRNVLHHSGSFDGQTAAQDARTWRDLQLAQADHDRYYHADVAGLSKAGQLRHYALHLAKLAGAAADVATTGSRYDDFVSRRVPDALLFGIKLATVSGQALGDEALNAALAEPPGYSLAPSA